MTPDGGTITIYGIDTGGNDEQTLSPTELNLWRVIRINSDNTIDMVSEYTSSKSITFYGGEHAYKMYVGTLQTIAAGYKHSEYTSGTRYMGYNGQTEIISILSDCTTNGNVDEEYGCGDTLYETDVNLVETAIGTLKAYKVNTTTAVNYYIASRRSYYNELDPDNDGSEYQAVTRSIVHVWNYNNKVSYSNLYYLDEYMAGPTAELTDVSDYIRPIVTLKSGLRATGDGTSGSPYVLK